MDYYWQRICNVYSSVKQRNLVHRKQLVVNNLPPKHISVLKEMWQSRIWSKYGLWFHFFWLTQEASSSESKLLCEVYWLSSDKMLHEFLQIRMNSPQDTETMPVKIILTLRDLLKWSISVIGFLTRRIWIDPCRVKLTQCFMWRLGYRYLLKTNLLKLLDLQELNSVVIIFFADNFHLWKMATHGILLDVVGLYVK